jgi:hypothetical protein
MDDHDYEYQYMMMMMMTFRRCSNENYCDSGINCASDKNGGWVDLDARLSRQLRCSMHACLGQMP